MLRGQDVLVLLWLARSAPEPAEHVLHERLARILEWVIEKPVVVGRHGPVATTGAASVVGANAYLRVMNASPEVELALYPADTLTQARAFYRRYHAVVGVRALDSLPGWHVRPNFHFGSFQRGYCWTCNQRPVNEYVRLWVTRIEKEAAVAPEHWDAYWSWLEAERIACGSDRPEFDRLFVMSNRPNAVPRAGLALSRRWPLVEVQPVGQDSRFRDQVREALREALAAFGMR